MIMNYLLKSKEENNKYRFFKISIYIIFVLILVSIIFPNASKSLVRRISSPFWFFKNNSLTGPGAEAFLHSREGLLSINEQLKAENEELLVKNSIVLKLEEENLNMREILNTFAKQNLVYAEVLASPPVSFFDTIVISNNAEKIRSGAEVLSSGGVPIGRVLEASKTTALVKLYSSPGSSFQIVFDNNNDVIEIYGMGGGFFKVKIPKSIKVLEGDNVYFRGTSKLIGVVKEIDENPSDSFKEVFVQSSINIFQIKSVVVSI